MAESEDDSAGRGRESLPLSEILAEVANSILGDSTLGSIDLRYSNLDGGNDELSALRSPSSAKFSSPQRGALQVDGEDSDIDGERSESVSGTSERHQESAKKKIHLTSPSVASGHQSSALMSPVIGSTPVRKEEEAVKNIPFFEDEEEEEEEEKNEKLKKSTSESDLNRDLSRRPTVDANGKTPPRVSPRAGEAAIVEEDEVNTPADEEEGEEGSDMGTGALEVTTEDEDAARSVQIVRELAQLVVTSEEKLEREQKEKEKLEESVFELKEEVQGLNQLIEEVTQSNEALGSMLQAREEAVKEGKFNAKKLKNIEDALVSLQVTVAQLVDGDAARSTSRRATGESLSGEKEEEEETLSIEEEKKRVRMEMEIERLKDMLRKSEEERETLKLRVLEKGGADIQQHSNTSEKSESSNGTPVLGTLSIPRITTSATSQLLEWLRGAKSTVATVARQVRQWLGEVERKTGVSESVDSLLEVAVSSLSNLTCSCLTSVPFLPSTVATHLAYTHVYDDSIETSRRRHRNILLAGSALAASFLLFRQINMGGSAQVQAFHPPYISPPILFTTALQSDGAIF